MKIYSVEDKEFAPYGEVIKGYDTAAMRKALGKFHRDAGTDYVASDKDLEATELARKLTDNVFGGLDAEVGCCWGINTKLNCLEYHRSSEINLADDDFILLLAKLDDIENGKLDTSRVKAFLCPKGVMINVYATTLHYAPCCAKIGKEFAVMVALPKGTNSDYRIAQEKSFEDKLLFARNKWLIAHKDTGEAKNGAYVGLTGENIDIAGLLK